MRKEYNMFQSLYQANLTCYLIDDESGKEVSRFMAREYGEKSLTSGFVPGGIASGGQSYMIATTDECVKKAEAMRSKVKVEGMPFLVTGKKINMLNPIRGYGGPGKIVEYVLILE